MGNENKNHREFLDKLYVENSLQLFRYAKSQLRDPYLAEVAVQETMLVALEKMDTLFNTSNPTAWLFEVLRRISKNMLSENAKIRKRLISLDDCVQKDLQMLDEVDIALHYGGVLSDEEFEIIEKLYVRRYTYQDLADEKGTPLSTIGMKAMRGKEKLRKYIENEKN
jgi:RNA polymerase sigma factor (sigma-70 family)